MSRCLDQPFFWNTGILSISSVTGGEWEGALMSPADSVITFTNFLGSLHGSELTTTNWQATSVGMILLS